MSFYTLPNEKNKHWRKYYIFIKNVIVIDLEKTLLALSLFKSSEF